MRSAPRCRNISTRPFSHIERVAELPRKRGPLTIETYGLDLVDGAKRDVLDPSPPPELE